MKGLSVAEILELPIAEGTLVALQRTDDRLLRIVSVTPEADSSSLNFELPLADFEKISMVEGIRLPEELKDQFRRFDRDGASDAERRRLLKEKYGTGAH